MKSIVKNRAKIWIILSVKIKKISFFSVFKNLTKLLHFHRQYAVILKFSTAIAIL